MKPYIVANWKMHPATLREAKQLFLRVKDPALKASKAAVVICPPAPYLPVLREYYAGAKLAFGAQDAHHERTGSYTGEHSAAMVKSAGARYVILGHSERRAMGEENALIARKTAAALAEGLAVILCVGESKRDRHGAYLEYIEAQLASALKGLEPKQMKHLLIAYEPIWAIGKSAEEAMEPQDVHEMILFIRKLLRKHAGEAQASQVPILYGGSVEPANSETLLRDGHVDGFLIGHASRNPKDFAQIIATAQQVARGDR